MAKAASTEEVVTSAGYDDSQFEWENIHEEAADQLIFDDPNDRYTGEYRGHEIIIPDPADPSEWFVKLNYRDNDGLKFTNAGYELRTVFVELTLNSDGSVASSKDRVTIGTMTRITLIKLVKVDQASPMKSFRVDVAKARS
jgi:hypothetical protein